MRNRKFISTVLIVAVVLGIVGCKNQSVTEIRKDDNEITTTNSVETQEETTENKEESTTTSETTSSVATSASDTVVPDLTEPSVSETEQIKPTETNPTKAPANDPAPTEAPKATATPVPTETSVPTATPEPTATPTSTPTPTPEPTPFDIDKSAKENGYEIIDIDMGGGKTERIYGYYVDMSELSSRINDYRESIGLSRLPTDSNHVDEMKTRAAEATVKFDHWRPNGHLGTEVNISGGVNVDTCYNGLFNSDAHRAWWEDTRVFSIYCVGFKRMQYDQESGKWVGYGGATVVFMDF
jgi:hypothetical protein